MENLSGQIAKGYDLLERIGSGGFGAVYRAHQSTIGREVAVKIILPAFANKPAFIRRFEIEAQLVARLEHLHIVPLYDYWRDPNGAYIVMRWLRGGSLSGNLLNGRFDLEQASLILDQVAAGLAAAHYQEIVHRDLKPSNILLDEEGNAYLADFGIARDLRQTNGTESDSNENSRLDARSEEQVLGSSQYRSPEQLIGQGATPQSDIYSLGITLYEVVSGQHPYPDLNSVEQLHRLIDEPLPKIDILDPEVSEGVNEVIQKATAKNPKHRFQDALAMAAAFRNSARLNRDGQTTDLVESLTRREQEILHLIIEGNTNQQITQNLFLELSTVKWHINRIYKKLGVRSRVQAIVRARDLKLIVPTDGTELEQEQNTSISVDLPEPVNPYKGLRAFEPADKRDFFGREPVVEQLLLRLAPTHASSPSRSALGLATNGSERFLAIVGPSGSGKSSLIKAGLISALRDGRLAGSDKWFVVEMLPGARPLDNLEIALMRIASDQASNLREHLDRDSRGLVRAARLILPNDKSQLVVVIDQFEELFTLVGDEAARNHFMDLIQGAVSDPHSRVRVVIALRADYYDRPLQYPTFGDLVRGHLETLLPLSAEELERAIVNPAYQSGVTFEPGLVATIIEDVIYRPGALPLLQFGLAELFEQRDGRMLTQSAYLAFGGAAGALARRAEELYQEQDAEEREAIRQMFLRLVSVSDQVTGAASDVPSPADTRKRVLRSELLSAASDPERLDEIIDTYAEYRLLSLDHHSATRQATVEVAHEAILREWDRLQGWVGDSLEELRLYKQLIRATNEWIEAGREGSFLLRGARLVHFASWANDTVLSLTLDEQAFLDASISGREARLAVERRRQEQEAHLEQRANRRLKALVGILVLGLVIAIGLAIAAVSFARRAEEQTRIAEQQQRLTVARELAAAALGNLELNPERSILLALEAIDTTYRVDGTVLPELENILHLAVQADRTEITIPMAGKVIFSPDGRSLAIGSSAGDLRLWDSDTGQQNHLLDGHTSLISGLSFSPEGRFLASSSFDGQVRIWDVASGNEIALITGHDGQVYNVALSPDGRQLATVDPEAVRIWDLTSLYNRNSDESRSIELSEPAVIQATPDVANTVIFSPDGQRVAALISGLAILVWDANLGEQVLEIPEVSDFVSGIAFSPNGEYLAGSAGGGGVALWNADTGEQVRILPETVPITGVAFSKDGRTLAAAAKNGMVTLWDMESSEQTISILGQPTGFNFMALSPDGQRVAAGNGPASTSVWDVGPTGGREWLTISAHEGKVHDAIYNPSGTRIASSGEDGNVRVWDAVTGELLHDLPAQREWEHFPAFSPDGERLAAANRDGGITIWDANTGEEHLAVYGDVPAPALSAIAFSPDGSRLAAGGKAGIVHIWDAVTGQRLTTIENLNGMSITELVYSLDGDHIFSYDLLGISRTWNDDSGELLTSLSTGVVCEATLWDAELSSDGRLQAMATFDGYAYVYHAVGEPEDPPRYEISHELAGHEGVVTGVGFNPEGTVLASSGFDGTARLWDLGTGEALATLTDQPLPLEGVDFSPDGRYVVTAGDDGTVRVYMASLEELMALARSRLSRSFTEEECQRYLHLPACAEG
jgi:WD40 repeat protein/serine/threonine protein kinase